VPEEPHSPGARISFAFNQYLTTLTSHASTSVIKIENFKMRIGIAEKSQETRRDCWGGHVNHKSLF